MQLIKNEWLEQELELKMENQESTTKRTSNRYKKKFTHEKLTAPPHASFFHIQNGHATLGISTHNTPAKVSTAQRGCKLIAVVIQDTSYEIAVSWITFSAPLSEI